MPASQNPNIMSISDSETAKTYYEMIFVTFFSLRKYNHGANLFLYTTEIPPSRYLQQLTEIDVLIKIVDFAHKPPIGYAKRFLGSFYLLDAIIAQPNVDCLYLDPDIICLKPLDEIFAQNTRIVAYPYGHGPNHDINGLTYGQSVTITNEIVKNDGNSRQEYTFYGGGFHYIPQSRHTELVSAINDFYKHSLERFRNGATYYTTEEHLLSAAYSRFGVSQASSIMKVVWTAPRYRRVSGTEMTFPLLHFPAEKEHGFKRTYRWLTQKMADGVEITNGQFELYVFKNFQLGRKSWARLLHRLLNLTIITLKKSIRPD
jgi:hypothetical protein